MAVAYQAVATVASGAGGASSLSTPTVDGSGTDRCVLAVCGSSAYAGGANPTGVTWDVATPENLTQYPNITALTYYAVSIWAKAAQTSATDTVTATWASTRDECIVAALTFTGVDGTTPVGNNQTSSGTSAEPSLTLTSVNSDDMCVDGVYEYPNNNATQGADQTERFDLSTTGTYLARMAGSTQPGTAGGAMTYSLAASPNWVYAALVLKAAAGGISVDCTTDALTLAEYAATVNATTEVDATTDALTLAEYQADVNINVSVSGTTDALTLAEYAANIKADTSFTASTDALTLAEYPATVNATTNVDGTTDALALAEYQADVNLNVSVSGTTDALALAEYAADVQVGADVNVSCTTDALTLAEYQASVSYDVNVSATTDALTIAEYPATVNSGVSVAATTDALSLAELAASVKYDVPVSAGVDALTLAEYAATVDVSAAVVSQPDYGAGGRYIRRKGRLIGKSRILDTVVYAKKRYIADITREKEKDLAYIAESRKKDIQFVPTPHIGTLGLSRAMKAVDIATRDYVLDRTRRAYIEKARIDLYREEEAAVILLLLAASE